MWAFERVFYQIYPLGFCGVPFENAVTERTAGDGPIQKIADWIPHIQKLGANALYLGPVFESDTHGYNTRDYRIIDRRLGTWKQFTALCRALHEADIKIILDGVFHHVGRGFFAFQDVLKNREQSAYKDWFYLNFDGNSNYNDGLWYEGWEGNYDLVKLNLGNEDVVSHLLDCVGMWIDDFAIDGLRLDVAYCLDVNFIRRLRQFCDQKKADFFLVGETLHGDYNQLMNDTMLHSVTNYECYKGLHSSFNSRNLFEIVHSLLRQFGPEDWTLYKGKHLLSFVDNHDVSRIATLLNNPAHLPLIYGLCFGMPGIPCIYYGSEWGAAGDKADGDPALRVSFPTPQWSLLTTFLAQLCRVKKSHKALNYGSFRSVLLTNEQCIFERCFDGERILVAINADSKDYMAYFDAGCQFADELLTQTTHDFTGGSMLPSYSVQYWLMRDHA